MFDRQTKKFCSAVTDALPEVSEDVMQVWIGNPTGLQKVLRLALCPPEVIPIPQPPLDFTIRVDRSVKPAYPDWVKKLMHTELELTGPANYDLETAVEEWCHDDQKTGVVNGQKIYDHLKVTNALADQLGLADLLAIQAKGIKVFRKLFKNKAVFGWKSVVQERDIRGILCVPYLFGDGGEVILLWSWLDDDWSSSSPALRFRK